MAKHRPLSKYARIAQNISDSILEKEQLLRQLTQLAAKKTHMTVDDDPTKEISSIVDIAKKSLPVILKDIETFHEAVQGEV